MKMIKSQSKEVRLLRVVYADTVLMLNFALDFASLYITCIFLGLYPTYKRMCFSSAMGASASLFFTILKVPHFVTNVVVVPIMVLMAYLNFGKSSVKTLVKRTFVLYVSSAVICGVCITVSGEMNQAKSEVFVLFIGVFVLLVCFIQSRICSGKCVSEKEIVIIKCGETERNFTLCCDSGNFLTDPLSGLPVIVLNALAKQRLLPDNIEETRLFKPRYIPVKTAVGTGVMFGIVPTEINVVRKGKNIKIKAVAAFSKDEMLCGIESDGVIPTCLIKNL